MLVPYRRSGYGPQQAGVDVIEVGLFRYCALRYLLMFWDSLADSTAISLHAFAR